MSGWIATAALVVMSWFSMRVAYEPKRFVDQFVKPWHTTQTGTVCVQLSQEDRNLLANFRRRKPAVKKETV